MIKCQFRGNKVNVGHGGSIAIRTTKAVNIRNCQFEANSANRQGDTNGDKGFSEAIYISTKFDSQCMMSVISVDAHSMITKHIMDTAFIYSARNIERRKM